MIKIIIAVVIIALAWAFLAEPLAQAGRTVSKQFKRIWSGSDEG